MILVVLIIIVGTKILKIFHHNLEIWDLLIEQIYYWIILEVIIVEMVIAEVVIAEVVIAEAVELIGECGNSRSGCGDENIYIKNIQTI
jgi:hypothetical protein